MQEIARSSHAICQSFFTVRRVPSVAARRSTALVLTRTSATQSKFSGTPRFPLSGRPYNVAIAPSPCAAPASCAVLCAPPSVPATLELITPCLYESLNSTSSTNPLEFGAPAPLLRSPPHHQILLPLRTPSSPYRTDARAG